MDIFKNFSNLESGDYVTVGTTVYFISKVGKKEYTAQSYTDAERTIKITKSGKVVGQGRHANLLRETPEKYLAKVEAEFQAKRKAEAEKEAKWQAKLETVRQALLPFAASEFCPGYYEVEFQDSKKRFAKLVYKVEQDTVLVQENGDYTFVQGVRLTNIVAWTFSWSSDQYPHPSMPGGESGKTVEDALVTLIAGTYWS